MVRLARLQSGRHVGVEKYVAPPKLVIDAWHTGLLSAESYRISPKVSPSSLLMASPRPLTASQRQIWCVPALAPSARERECYALGFVDALKKRDYGSSIGANDAEHDDLVEATLEDLPPEAQGIRDQWAARSGIGRKEDVRAAADS